MNTDLHYGGRGGGVGFWLKVGPLCLPLDWEPPEVRVYVFPSGLEFLKDRGSDGPIKWKPPEGRAVPPCTQMPPTAGWGQLLKLGLQDAVAILIPLGPRLNCLQTCLESWGAFKGPLTPAMNSFCS